MIRLPQSIYNQIKAQARAEAPNEACGYLAGSDGEVQEIIPMKNADECPKHFSFNPEEQFAALEKATARGVNLFSVYHSHPATPAAAAAASPVTTTAITCASRYDPIAAYRYSFFTNRRILRMTSAPAPLRLGQIRRRSSRRGASVGGGPADENLDPTRHPATIR